MTVTFLFYFIFNVTSQIFVASYGEESSYVIVNIGQPVPLANPYLIGISRKAI